MYRSKALVLFLFVLIPSHSKADLLESLVVVKTLPNKEGRHSFFDPKINERLKDVVAANQPDLEVLSPSGPRDIFSRQQLFEIRNPQKQKELTAELRSVKGLEAVSVSQILDTYRAAKSEATNWTEKDLEAKLKEAGSASVLSLASLSGQMIGAVNAASSEGLARRWSEKNRSGMTEPLNSFASLMDYLYRSLEGGRTYALMEQMRKEEDKNGPPLDYFSLQEEARKRPEYKEVRRTLSVLRALPLEAAFAYDKLGTDWTRLMVLYYGSATDGIGFEVVNQDAIHRQSYFKFWLSHLGKQIDITERYATATPEQAKKYRIRWASGASKWGSFNELSASPIGEEGALYSLELRAGSNPGLLLLGLRASTPKPEELSTEITQFLIDNQHKVERYAAFYAERKAQGEEEKLYLTFKALFKGESEVELRRQARQQARQNNSINQLTSHPAITDLLRAFTWEPLVAKLPDGFDWLEYENQVADIFLKLKEQKFHRGFEGRVNEAIEEWLRFTKDEKTRVADPAFKEKRERLQQSLR